MWTWTKIVGRALINLGVVVLGIVAAKELQIAGAVAAAMTVVLLARRWTQLALGTGKLNSEFFAGNLAVGTLVAAVEARMEGGSPRTRTSRSTRSRVPGGSDDAS